MASQSIHKDGAQEGLSVKGNHMCFLLYVGICMGLCGVIWIIHRRMKAKISGPSSGMSEAKLALTSGFVSTQ